ncbi:MAG: hypothetical protein K2H04_10820 [Bacteroidaceae bacterium]|nr:hypothetical protein [Bacteroidaceae bacterium]
METFSFKQVFLWGNEVSDAISLLSTGTLTGAAQVESWWKILRIRGEVVPLRLTTPPTNGGVFHFSKSDLNNDL